VRAKLNFFVGFYDFALFFAWLSFELFDLCLTQLSYHWKTYNVYFKNVHFVASIFKFSKLDVLEDGIKGNFNNPNLSNWNSSQDFSNDSFFGSIHDYNLIQFNYNQALEYFYLKTDKCLSTFSLFLWYLACFKSNLNLKVVILKVI